MLAASTLLAAPPFDQPPGGQFPPPAPSQRGEPLPPFLHGVALTNEQRKQIDEVRRPICERGEPPRR